MDTYFQRTYTNEPMTHRQVVRFSYRSQHLTKETHLQEKTKVIRGFFFFFSCLRHKKWNKEAQKSYNVEGESVPRPSINMLPNKRCLMCKPKS